MVDAVNRLTGDLLSGVGELFLPEVGSLQVERCAAERLSRNRIRPPYRTVAFSSQQRGASLVDEIARAANVDAEKAAEIYRTWRARVATDNGLVIEGVGELKGKSFVLDPAFDRLLNPQGHAPVRVKPARRFDWVLWVGICAAVFVLAGVAWWWFDGQTGLSRRFSLSGRASEPTEVAAGMQPAPESAADGESAVDGEPVAVSNGAAASEAGPANASVMPAADSSAAQKSDAAVSGRTAISAAAPSAAASSAARPAVADRPTNGVISFISGHRYVVLGVFSTEENAARAVAAAEERDPSVRCGIYRFGAKFLVSPFESEDAGACAQYIRAHADNFPGMWTYTAR